MIKLYNNKQDCCGCSACATVCPRKCIKIAVDDEGFMYPKINYISCINCELCVRVCPIIFQKKQNKLHEKNNVQAYVAYNKSETNRMNSSSGGIFTAIAEFILREDGVIFGAAFDKNFMVYHIVVKDVAELNKLRGSKYTQSNMGNTYSKVKKYLKLDQKVLFSGTACQIAGLKSYLGKEYTNLFTVDVLCHGVPSPKVWKKYLSALEQEYGKNISEINFRNKDSGWKNFSMKINFDNSLEYSRVFSKDVFMRLFLSNICLRPSCHNCLFKEFPHVSDITIGDCWGIEDHSPEMDDDKGTSIVVINSNKGKKLKEFINDSCIWKKSVLDTILPLDADSRRSVSQHVNRKKFFKLLNKDKSIYDLLKVTKPSIFFRIKNKITHF